MATCHEQFKSEVLTLCERVRLQIVLNEVWADAGIPFQYNSEGTLVVTRAIPFAFRGSHEKHATRGGG